MKIHHRAGWFWLFLTLLATAPSTDASTADAPAAGADRPAIEAPRNTAPAIEIPATGPLRLTLAGAVEMTLQNNRALVVERITPRIQKTYIDQERAIFDPLVRGDVQSERIDRKQQSNTAATEIVEKSVIASLSMHQFFPTGTTVAVEAGADSDDSSLYRDRLAATAMGINFSQALLRGFGREVNTARLRQAEIDVDISAHELQGFSEALVARVETAYWDLALAGRQVDIVAESVKVAEQQQAETEQMIAVGTLAEAELPAVEAEVALQRQALIGARGDFQSARLELLRLFNPPSQSFWNRDIELLVRPEVPEINLDPVADHVAVGLQMRAEIHQARLQIRRNELAVVQTKNGLLPRLDLFVRLGKTGFADSFSGALENSDGRHYDVVAGLGFEYPPVNRAAKARHLRARLEKRQADRAMANLAQLVELDVRLAYINVERTRQQITASTATRKLQEEKSRIEIEKFRVGRSTSFLVAQAQRDLLSSRIAEVKAVVDYLKALTDLFRLDGSLLVRRGLTIGTKALTERLNG